MKSYFLTCWYFWPSTHHPLFNFTLVLFAVCKNSCLFHGFPTGKWLSTPCLLVKIWRSSSSVCVNFIFFLLSETLLLPLCTCKPSLSADGAVTVLSLFYHFRVTCSMTMHTSVILFCFPLIVPNVLLVLYSISCWIFCWSLHQIALMFTWSSLCSSALLEPSAVCLLFIICQFFPSSALLCLSLC